MNHLQTSLAALLAMAAYPLSAAGQTASALVTATSGKPLSAVPGLPGAEFSSFTQSAVRLSRTGRYWAVTVNATGLPATGDTFVLVGTAAGIEYVVREEEPLPGVGVGFQTRPDALLGINDKGDLAFTGRLATGSFGNDDMAVRFDKSAGLWSFVAQEGSPIPGVAGESFSSFIESITLLDDGRAAFAAISTNGPTPSAQDEWFFLSGAPNYTTIAQVGFLVPANQAGGTTFALRDIFEGSVDGTGQQYLLEGALNGAPSTSDRVLVVNGAVVLQEGQPVPGLTGTVVSTFDGPLMFPGGHWAYNGGTSAAESYLCINGQFKIEGDPVPGGAPSEVFTQFRDIDINLHGDVAYLASSNLRSSVVVVEPAAAPGFVAFATGFNAVTTGGTRLDVDGDCVLDNAYLVFANDDTVSITADRRVYLAGRFANSFNLTEADALFSASFRTPFTDCDGNGRDDSCEISKNPLLDLDLDGALDLCSGVATLTADALVVSASEGGVQTFALDAGASNGNSIYVLLGSLSGTSPGLPLDGVVLPLVADAYTLFTLNGPAPLLSGSVGLLDANGEGTAAFQLPPNAALPGLVGKVVHHAYVVFAGTQFVLASNPVGLLLGP